MTTKELQDINLTTIIDSEFFESCANDHHSGEISQSMISHLNDYFTAFYEVYPDGDIQLAYNDRQYTPKFIIKFDEFVIMNSNDNSHIIRDLLVSFVLEFKHGNFYIDSNSVEGMRLSMTPVEIMSRYGHSHLSGSNYDNNSTVEFSNFCLGNGGLPESILLFNGTPNINKFKLLLFQIESFVKWESLDGGPYRKIADLKAVSKNYHYKLSNSDYQEIDQILKSNLTVEDFNLMGGSNIEVQNDKLLSDTLVRLLPNKYHVYTEDVINDDGKLIINQFIINDITSGDYNKPCNIVFKKKHYSELTIIPSNIINHEAIKISKEVIEFVIDKLNNKLKYYILYEN